MCSRSSMTSISAQDLVDRTNRLIVKHSLPVPRFVSSRFINYQFWSVVFIKLFHIKCDISLRTLNQRVDMVRSCLNKLGSLIGVSLDHIKPTRLLNYDSESILNLLEIAEVWSEYFDDDEEEENHSNVLEISDIDQCSSRFLANSCSKSEPNISHKTSQTFNNSKSMELANLLYSALKNLLIALEIEKKIKAYLGDVTTRNRVNDHLIRASRQSIVRTRAIQPSATFDFDLTRKDKQNPILSIDLERCFPEVPAEMMNKIRHLEQDLLIFEGNMRPWQPGQLNRRLNHMLNYVIAKQQRNLDCESKTPMKRLSHCLKQINPSPLETRMFQRELRTQRAALQDEINQFYKSATASYLNARSYLERILVEEFRKVEQHQRDHIQQIREYLRNHEQVELDKVRNILETIEQWI